MCHEWRGARLTEPVAPRDVDESGGAPWCWRFHAYSVTHSGFIALRRLCGPRDPLLRGCPKSARACGGCAMKSTASAVTGRVSLPDLTGRGAHPVVTGTDRIMTVTANGGAKRAGDQGAS
jgi:hypothetical protein